MPEGHPGVDHGETISEAREEAAAELESAPKLVLSEDEMHRAGRRMGDADFAKFAFARGIDFSEPVTLVLDGVEVGQKFSSAEEMRSYIKDSVERL